MTEKQFLLAYDRKRTSTLALDSEPGAHTGTTRQYIPGYSDSNIVYLDTVSGNDSNDGSTELLAKLTYASAATAAGSTKKIRVINNGAALSTNITKPTEMKRGLSGTISSSLNAPVDTWTQAATPALTNNIRSVSYSNELNLYVAGNDSGKTAYSADGNTWVLNSGTLASGGTLDSIKWVQKLYKFFLGGENATIAMSDDGQTWQETTLHALDVGATSAFIGFAYSLALGRIVAVTQDGGVAYSDDDGASWVTIVTLLNIITATSALYSDYHSKFYITCTAGVYISDDGVNWSEATTQPSGQISTMASNEAGVLVVVGGTASPEIYRSTDGGLVWAASASVSLTTSVATGCDYIPEIGRFVAANASGQISYSADGDTWSNAATPSYGGTAIRRFTFSPLQGRVVSVGNSAKIAYSTAYANTISANIAGFTVQAMQYSGTVTAYNCTMKQPGTTANLSLNACRITEAGSHISSNTATSFATLFEGDRYTTCTPAAQNDIDCNLDTVGGTWYIYNASATGFERVRDCLVTDGIIANFNITVSGRANIQGDSENILIDAEVTTDDPKFVDTTDYKLQYQTNGYPRNSLAAGRSAIYFNSAGDARDIGAWSYVESAVSYYFAKSVVLYKGEITHEIEEAISEQQGDSGVVSVYGNTNRIKEIVTITYGSTREEDRAFIDYMRSLKDKGVKLILDAEWESNVGSVTVNGNQSAGVEFLTVDSTTYFNGLWVTVSGKRYWIMRASPSNSAATKLILDRPLEDAVTDNQILVTNYPPGIGEYQFSPQSRLTLKRAAPDGLTGWQSGLVLRFVRKYQ